VGGFVGGHVFLSTTFGRTCTALYSNFGADENRPAGIAEAITRIDGNVLESLGLT